MWIMNHFINMDDFILLPQQTDRATFRGGEAIGGPEGPFLAHKDSGFQDLRCDWSPWFVSPVHGRSALVCEPFCWRINVPLPFLESVCSHEVVEESSLCSAFLFTSTVHGL